MAHCSADWTGGAKRVELVVLVELAEGHAQAIVWEDQEHFIQ